MTPGSYVLAHSPLTGPAAWGKLPTLLREQAHEVVVINVQDDDEPPFAERYLMRARAQIGAAELAPPTILVAHSGAGPLLPLIMTPPPRAHRPGNHGREVARPRGYVFLDAGIPRPGQPSRMDLLREEDGSLATEFLESLRAGTRFPAWTIDDLADIVPAIADRVALIQSLRPRGWDFFTEPLPPLDAWPDAPCGYLRTSPAYDYSSDTAVQRGWPVVCRDLGHFPALASPEATLDALFELTARL